MTVRDVPESALHPSHSQIASDGSSASHTVCAHVQEHPLDCLLHNTFVLDLSPKLAFVSTIRPLLTLSSQSFQGNRLASVAFHLIRAPPLVAR